MTSGAPMQELTCSNDKCAKLFTRLNRLVESRKRSGYNVFYCSRKCNAEGKGFETHGAKGTPTWQSWRALLDNCRNKKKRSYKSIGGRGISFDPRWLSYPTFLADMGERPDGMMLRRKDTTKNYTKDNCVWDTPESRRKRKRVAKGKILIKDTDGTYITVPEYATKHGVNKSGLYFKVRCGAIPHILEGGDNAEVHKPGDT